MTIRAPDSRRQASVARGLLPAILVAVAVIAIGVLIARASSVSAASRAHEADASLYFPAKLKVLRATVRNGTLEMLLSITGRATGAITVDYQAAGRFHRTFAAVGPPQEGEKRVAVSQPLADHQRAVETGIVNAAFAGNETTQADSARLRAAKGRSRLTLERLTFVDGRVAVAGSIDERVSGIVRLRASYLDSDGSTGVWNGRAAVERGAWGLDEKLPAAATDDPNAYLSMQFTGQKNAPGGPYRGEQIGKSLGNLEMMRPPPPTDDGKQPLPDDPDACGGADEDECGEGDDSEE
ncbi:MAG: hypothetical protein WKF42_00885 [Solirubrobacteraceae bacterium]